MRPPTVSSITNDLDSLIELGHIYFTGLPLANTDLFAPSSSPHHRWADFPFMKFRAPECHPVVDDLVAMQAHRYIMATFRVVPIGETPVAQVTVYGVPQDVRGGRVLNEWRRRRTPQLLRQWFGVLTAVYGPQKVFDYGATSAKWSFLQPPAQYWSANEVGGSLDANVKWVYDHIAPPKYSKPAPSVASGGFPTTSDVVARVIVGDVPGITTSLFDYQQTSVATMLERESATPRVAPVPNYVPLPRGGYYDVLTHQLFREPEVTKLPRGGILAENMGLGKTLICLAMICATKHEVAQIPPDLVTRPVKPQRHKPTLVELCIDKIGLDGLPWRYFLTEIPAHLIEPLTMGVGRFEIPVHSNGEYDQYTRVRNRSSQRAPTETRELMLSNGTLVVCPNNLFHQWANEIAKHVEPGFLRVLYVSAEYNETKLEGNCCYTREIPPSLALLEFDLVVVTASQVTRMSAEGLEAIYWKRLIVDEGHSMNSKSRTSDVCSNTLMCERKWVVSGTPTSGLTHLHMEEDTSNYTVKNRFDPKQDLAKLGVILGKFLRLEPYFTRPKLWHTTIVKPFEQGSAAAQGALLALLNQVMIRHGDIQYDLPPLHHSVTFIEPSFFNQLAVNSFTAVLAVNAVSSEREDIDYMFHPRNRPELRRLITNLQRATVFWTGFSVQDLKGLISVCNHCLEKKNYTPEDEELLHKSKQLAEMAMENTRWRSAAESHEMLYYIDKKELPTVYARGVALATTPDEYVFGAPQLGAVQEIMYKNRFAKRETIQAEVAEAMAKMEKKPTPKRKKDLNDQKDKKEKPEVVLEKALIPDQPDEDTSFDRVRQCQLKGVASAKLAYLVSRLLDNQRHGVKSIVFFDFEDHAYYLSELLDVVGANYILYATFISARERAANLDEFSASADGVALVMDLRLASHGLTIIAATHVYFISPTWQKSVEAQAIKRAHRIGQTKPVTVETLVLTGTLEEEIYNTRSQEDKSEKYVIDNAAMQRYILRHEFMPMNHHEFSEFVAPATGPDEPPEETEPGSLLNHTSRVTFDNACEWDLRVFSRANMEKLQAHKAKVAAKKRQRELERAERKRIRL
ncbi:hypothetical protein DICA1_D17392 [Diutina catenulata]